MSLTIIPPDPDKHAEAIFAMLDLIWQGSSTWNREGRINHSHYDWQVSQIGYMGDRLVTHYGVYGLTQRIGSAQVRSAGINLVATDPDYQKRGLMDQTIWPSLKAMRDQGYDISVTCNGIPNYYHRYGYIFSWPETDFTVELGALPKAPPDFEIKSFDSCDPGDWLLTAMSDLYNDQNTTVTGTAVKPTYPRGKIPGEKDGLYWTDEAGKLAGFINGEPDPGKGVFWVEDGAGDPDEILRVVAEQSRQADLKKMRALRLPMRGALGKRLQRMNAIMETKFWTNGGFMLRIVNLRSLFEKLAAELSRRLPHSHLAAWQGDLLIDFQHETVTDEAIILSIEQGIIHVGPPTETKHIIRGGLEIGQLVIGTYDPVDIIADGNIELGGDAAQLVEALFPAQDPQISGLDL